MEVVVRARTTVAIKMGYKGPERELDELESSVAAAVLPGVQVHDGPSGGAIKGTGGSPTF